MDGRGTTIQRVINGTNGATPKKTTPGHPPANGMVERFNRNLKYVIHVAYAENKDPEEEVQKYV